MIPPAVVMCPSCRRELPEGARFCPVCGARLQPAPPADPLLGTVVGERYRLLERLGSGRTGMIYRAEHVTLHRRAAVKLLHPALTTDPACMDRFSREARVVAELDNEHLVSVVDYGKTSAGQLYLAMELLEGETLAEHLRRHARLGAERTLDILGQVADGLMEVHAMGYVHRDLRPSNLFLVKRRGRELVKLLGFGVAKMVGGDMASVSGISVADPTYMSPEQARGETVDGRSDIYSLAIVGYEMLIGAPPFSGHDISRVVRQHLEAAPAAPRLLRPDISPAMEAALLQALAKRPDDRFATMLRFIEALGARPAAAPLPVAVPVVPSAMAAATIIQSPARPLTSPPPAGPVVELPKVIVSPSAVITPIPATPSPAIPVAPPAAVTPTPVLEPLSPRRPLDARMPTPGLGTMEAPSQSGVWFAHGDEMDRQAREQHQAVQQRELEEQSQESTSQMAAAFVSGRRWLLYLGVAVTSLLLTLAVGATVHRCSEPGAPPANTVGH